MKPQAIVFTWREVDVVDDHGEVWRTLAMVPIPRYGNVARRQFGDAGTEHTLAPFEERSMRSHSQYFCALGDYFDNLPHIENTPWPTEEHFRAWLLIETGWCEQKEFECINAMHARRLAEHIRIDEPYSRIKLHGKMVTVRKPKSQSVAAMGKRDFEESKRAVLTLAEGLTGISRTEMMKHAGRYA